MLKIHTPEQLSKAYRSACMAELQALKPGNVHVFADGHGMTIHDFIQSADATADVITRSDLSLGERVLYAVEANHKMVGQNTNLGMLLLCAPLIHSAIYIDATTAFDVGLARTLAELTTQDAQLVAKAIILANPAGLGRVGRYDVHETPQVTLLEMMQVAKNNDRIAWQYANDFEDVLGFGVDRYHKAISKWQNAAWATTALYLGFLSKLADTHVIRKHGYAVADEILNEALEMDLLHWHADNPKLVQKRLLDWDTSLKMRGINPGTSADLTVATLLATFLV